MTGRAVGSVVGRTVGRVTGSRGGGGSATLDILAKVGTSTNPTSIGTKAVTGVGFTPKAVLPFGCWNVSDGVVDELVLSLGAARTTSSRAAVSVSARSLITTSATHRLHTATKAISHVYNGATNYDADFSAFGADGFTLDWSTVGTARILNHICLGGADLEVAIVQGQMNATNTAQAVAHGMTGAPTGGLGFFAVNSTAPANISTILKLGVGAFAGSSQWGASIYSNTGVTTTATRRLLSTSHLMADLTTAVQRSIAISSVDSTNVNFTFPDTTAATQYYFWLMLVRGAKCAVGTFNANGSTSAINLATTGLTPKLFLPVFIPNGVSSAGSVSNGLVFGLGASDGTNNVSCGISDQDGQTTTNARRFQSSSALCEYNAAGTKSFEATAAFSGQSVVVTPTTAAANFGQAAFLVIGN